MIEKKSYRIVKLLLELIFELCDNCLKVQISVKFEGPFSRVCFFLAWGRKQTMIRTAFW